MSLANHRAWRAFGGNICCPAFDGTSARQVALPEPDRHAHRDGPGGRGSARSRARARLRVVRPALAGVHPKAERAALARTYHEVREPTLATDARRLEVQPDAVAAPATDPRAAQVLALQRTVGNRLAALARWPLPAGAPAKPAAVGTLASGLLRASSDRSSRRSPRTICGRSRQRRPRPCLPRGIRASLPSTDQTPQSRAATWCALRRCSPNRGTPRGVSSPHVCPPAVTRAARGRQLFRT
jgi:hypothetical protein